MGCDRLSAESDNLPTIKNNQKQVFSEETAYQMTSILQGVVQRGTGKKLRDLDVPLAGKTGTTNNNYDAWFIGFSSNLVIGVYIGFDNPKTLENMKQAQKPLFQYLKNFVKSALFKEDFQEFVIPKGIYFAPINYDTGVEEDFNNSKAIIEAFKIKDINKIKNKNLDITTNYDKLIKFRQFY